jgi:ribosomal protein L40E
MPKKSKDLLNDIDEIIPQLAGETTKYNVTEVLADQRYEFFAVPVSAGGIGDMLFRGMERTFRGDWGKARDSYDVPGSNMAERLRMLRTALETGTIELRNYEVAFDPSTIKVQDSKFKLNAKIMFEITFIAQPTKTSEKPASSKTETSSDVKFCSKCGAQLEFSASFCYRCGTAQ